MSENGASQPDCTFFGSTEFVDLLEPGSWDHTFIRQRERSVETGNGKSDFVTDGEVNGIGGVKIKIWLSLTLP